MSTGWRTPVGVVIAILVLGGFLNLGVSLRAENTQVQVTIVNSGLEEARGRAGLTAARRPSLAGTSGSPPNGGQLKTQAAVAEPTPRTLANHPNWRTFLRANKQYDAGQEPRVRIASWLLLDQEHREQLAEHRARSGRSIPSRTSTCGTAPGGWTETHPRGKA